MATFSLLVAQLLCDLHRHPNTLFLFSLHAPAPRLQSEARNLSFGVCSPLSSLSVGMRVGEEVGEKEEKNLGGNRSPHLTPAQCGNPADTAGEQD